MRHGHNVIRAINESALRNGTRPALLDHSVDTSYRELASILRFAQEKVIKADRFPSKYVIVREASQRYFVMTVLLLMSCGKWAIPISKDATDDELEDITRKTGASLFDDEFWLDLPQYEVYDGALPIVPDERQTGILHMTSGSTGEPKYCVKTLEALSFEGNSFAQAFGISADDKLLSLCPLCHAFAFGAAAMSSFMAGACLCIRKSLSPRRVLTQIREQRITYLAMAPTIARLLCLTTSAYPITGLRVALVGAGAVDSDLYAAFYERFSVFLSRSYGSTETGGAFAQYASENNICSVPCESVGKAMPSVEFKINSDKARAETAGQLWIRSPAMFERYFNGTVPFDSDGYYNTGDYVRLDDNGNMFIMGRTDGFVKISGKSYNLALLENLMKRKLNTENFHIVVKKDANSEPLILLYVVGDKHLAVEASDLCKKFLPADIVPRVIPVGHIQKNDLGKIQMHYLEHSAR
jgi:long-chain acyl-CoA synthetase